MSLQMEDGSLLETGLPFENLDLTSPAELHVPSATAPNLDPDHTWRSRSLHCPNGVGHILLSNIFGLEMGVGILASADPGR